MSKKLKEMKSRFIETMDKVADIVDIDPTEVKRDEYVRVSVDNDINGRLNKVELSILGGFKEAKKMFIRPRKREIQQPKILIFDIETAPILGYVWGLWKNNVGLNQIHSDWYVLSWSAKWLGDSADKVMYMDQRDAENIEDDTELLQAIWELLDEADIVVTQNGVSFDEKKLNTRFILNGFEPPSTFRHIDTYRIAKKKFKFTSNKLEYMTSKLCKKYKKSKHAKYTGFNLWKACLAGDIEAWKEMEDYNKLDVLSLEELYTKLIPWDGSINFNAYHDSLENVCTCGSKSFKKAGFHVTNAGRYQRYKCKSCGKVYREIENLISLEKRKKMLRRA